MNQQIKAKIVKKFFSSIGDLLHQSNKTAIELIENDYELIIKVNFDDSQISVAFFDTSDPNIEEEAEQIIINLWCNIMSV